MNQVAKSLETIFAKAIEIASPENRRIFLDQACEGDPELRQSVEKLVGHHVRAGSFLESPAVDVGATVEVHSLSEHPGTIVGPYKLLQQIGEGGMGAVFMAEQTEPIQRKVALKIIKPGMDTRQVIARFEAERQALAMMEHPNIAKVLDAGTTESGRPYFVMELVKGVPITRYCDEKRLSVRERLELVLPICHAVQHAHQKGIIHRDIKPSNVLVAEHDDRPIPQIIDFGVVKATAQRLTDRTVFTEFGQVIGTVEYMSPEQAKFNQLDVDTRSDIYSLGVLLYELLTGTTPFEQKRLREAAFDEVLRIIREEEPPNPSTRLSTSETLPSIAANRHTEPVQLSKEVRGELDWIVMRALEKNRQRRYQTSNELAEDLKYYLSDEPVRACPPSRAYRLKKFLRRNKVGVVATAGIAAALVLGLVAASIGFVQARRQAEIARTQAVRSEEVAQFLKDMLKGVAPSKALGRDTTMLQEIVDATAARIERDLKDQPQVQIELMLTLGQVYYDLQNYGEMEKNARRTLELARSQFGEENIAVADALGQLGRALMFLRKINEAEPTARKAIELQRRLRGPESLQEATSLLNLADILRHLKYATKEERQKQLVEAETAAHSAVAIRRKTLGEEDDETAWALLTWSINLNTLNRLSDAEAAMREAHDIRMRLHGENHPYTAADKCYLGLILKSEGKFEEAEECLRESLTVTEKMNGKGRISQINAHCWLGDILDKNGKYAGAEAEYRAAIAIGVKEVGSEYLDLPTVLSGLAIALANQGKLDEAYERAEEAIAICQRHPEIEPGERYHAEKALQFVTQRTAAAAAKAPSDSTRADASRTSGDSD